MPPAKASSKRAAIAAAPTLFLLCLEAQKLWIFPVGAQPAIGDPTFPKGSPRPMFERLKILPPDAFGPEMKHDRDIWLWKMEQYVNHFFIRYGPPKLCNMPP